MCGHVFLYNKNSNINEDLLRELTEKINHRGPDDTGLFVKDNVGFGFKRLSIIDLSHGHQPLSKKESTIIFNGEIYNHEYLRAELITKGYEFNTESDTEVLLTSYLEHGKSSVKDLRGMFAFVIYDERTNTIFGARDHFGIKPLYYTENDEYIAFSSEYKALLPIVKEENVDDKSLQNYLSFQYVPGYKTMMEGIKKVPNGTCFTIEDNQIKFEKYFEARFTNEEEVTKEDVYNILNDSVKHHMISNVEVGTFLSGGIDSTIIAALASKINPKIKSFSVGFEVDGYNELNVAKKTADALGIENIQIRVTQDDYINALPKVIYSLDDPLADPSCVGIYFLSKEARKHVTVVLSGEGADEFFAGYNIYKEYEAVKPFLTLPKGLNKTLNKIFIKMPELRGKNYLVRATTPLEKRYIGNAKIFENNEVKSIINKYDDNNTYSRVVRALYRDCKRKNYDYVTTMQDIDINTWLEGDILLKGDKMSMASSIELRVPFLDKEVFNVAKNLRLDQKISNKNTKVLLREAFKDVVPQHMVEKKKLGFPTPIRVWLKDDLGKYVKNVITESKTDDIINKEYAIGLLDEHIKGSKDNSRKVWTVFVFCLWHQIFIEGKKIDSL
ncbi:asparagine synthase (glutamine-hydrolyzing) [Paraclostridium ghonii]|uniref:asparagine synthase (glutamine-hydrolyzing) n=1 Tax=Paraclostridium ghonii TaxID=29358 RepID=UPI00202D02D1|nr:asparagine synthase (glutamine-hydrolyzing) [Paeniclostridium ghonii]MCM0167324.1 asparagine synthase (glutamine-hydrolyzing) [Paeniclostridium ghonii]